MPAIARFWNLTLLSTVLLAATSSIVHARDFCIDLGTSPNTDRYVGKSFRAPTKGKCRAWHGYISKFAGGAPVPQNAQIGTGCTTMDGSMLELTVTTTTEPGVSTPGRVYFDFIRVPLNPLLSGTDTFSRLDPYAQVASTARLAACAPEDEQNRSVGESDRPR